MNIVVFGAGGATGQHLTRRALAEGHRVTAVTRRPEEFPLQDPAPRVTYGDVFDFSSVERAIAGQDAVLAVYGFPFGFRRITAYSRGAEHIMRAMRRHGVRRLIAVTSGATDPHPAPDVGPVLARVLQPFFVNVVGRTLYDDMRLMERMVRESELDWTIIRPSGLYETPGITDYEVAERRIGRRFTSRADLADFMLRQLGDDRYVRKAVAVATVTLEPNILNFLWNEGIRKRPVVVSAA